MNTLICTQPTTLTRGETSGPQLLRILLICSILSCSFLRPALNVEGSITAHQVTYKRYDAVAESGLIVKVLNDVIARGGKSKTYTDLLPLDGGTIGIANFATGGLASLYRQMNTEKYFGRSREEMIAKYSTRCRPTGKSGNDTGWGCYSRAWWRDGMQSLS